METVRILNNFGVILAVLGFVVLLVGLVAPGLNARYRGRANRALPAGILLLVLGLGLLLVIYLTGLLV